MENQVGRCDLSTQMCYWTQFFKGKHFIYLVCQILLNVTIQLIITQKLSYIGTQNKLSIYIYIYTHTHTHIYKENLIKLQRVETTKVENERFSM